MIFLSIPILNDMLMSYTPEANQNAHYAGEKGNPVCTPVTLQPFRTTPFSARQDLRMMVKYCPIAQIKDISAYNGCKRHEPPINRESMHPKRIDNQRRERAKERSIRQPRETGDNP